MNSRWKSRERVTSRGRLQDIIQKLQEVVQALQEVIHMLEGGHAIQAPSSSPAPPLAMTNSVYEAIQRTVGNQPAEHGGLLGGQNGLVKEFHFDDTARRTGATYSPDHKLLTRLLKEEWNPRNIRLLGFIHSHPPGVRRPSGGDLTYARDILRHNPHLDRLLLPIVMSEPDTGHFEILPFAALRDGNDVRVERLTLSLVNDREARPFSPIETFRRVRHAYDLDRLASARVIYVGTGGAAAFVEDMARAGVGQHVLIDPDIVSETNLATQQVYRKHIGHPKVDCLAERIWDINPNAVVVARQKRLEEIDDDEFGRLATAPLGGRSPAVSLLCGLTDNFEAQTRVNRLALHLGLPSLCAQVYREGRGAEITFTYPGVTPACHRCALSSRYKAYLEQGFKNNVTSDGTPIFSTTRLNALKGFVGMAILHHGTNHPRWGGLLERIGNRNLIQIRMDPDLKTTLGLGVFDRVFGGSDPERILFDEAVWLPQKPDCPENGFPTCPDCGGTGDLHQAIGTFEDTRPMRLPGGEHAPVPSRQ